MNDFNMNHEAPRRAVNSTLLIVGIGMVILGCLLALENLTSFAVGHRVDRYWPLIIVAIGVVKIIENKFRGYGGWIITIVGLLIFASTMQGRSIGHLVGPAILVAVGVFVVQIAQKRHRKVPIALQRSGDFARGTAILGGYKYKPNGGQFSGGEITAIFGGFEMDLRQTTMKHDTVRIDVFCMMGGGEILVPGGWEVSIQAQAIVGAVEDKTIALPTTDATRPKLLITGFALFGGVVVK